MVLKSIFFKNKKGGQDVMYPIIIFVILNLIFFSILLLFVQKSSTGALVYEQAYAKQIALLIDRAEPSTRIVLDFKEGIEIAGKNNLASRENLVSKSNNEVIVKLSEKGGYGFRYFSSHDFDFSFEEDNLVITVGG